MIEKGLITYLPYKIQFLLLRRSFFDVLCDFVYFSKAKLYLSAIFTPFFIKPKPKEISKYLNVIPKEERKVFFTKGIVYTFPKKI